MGNHLHIQKPAFKAQQQGQYCGSVVGCLLFRPPRTVGDDVARRSAAEADPCEPCSGRMKEPQEIAREQLAKLRRKSHQCEVRT